MFKTVNFQVKLGWVKLFPSQSNFNKKKIGNIKLCDGEQKTKGAKLLI